MRSIFSVLFPLVTLASFGQVDVNKFLTSGTLRIKYDYQDKNTYKTFQAGFTSKTGWFASDLVVVGVKADYAWTHENVFKDAPVRQVNGIWFVKAVRNRHEYAIGLFADRYFQLGKKFYITVGGYGQYYHYTDVEVGEFLDQNENSLNRRYEIHLLPVRIAQLGLTNTIVYFLNKRFGINCLVSSIDVLINGKYRPGVEFDFKVPRMNFGVQYHFPE